MHPLRGVPYAVAGGLLFVLSSPVAAQNCKPDFSGKDKMTKVEVAEWSQNLYQTGFLASALLTSSEINITAAIQRKGDSNLMIIVLSKQEENVARAVVESPYRAEKGNEFLFGFKEGGTPLTFVAVDVSNNISADMFGKLNTRVILTAKIKDEDLRALKDSLAGKQIDVVRVAVANPIEKSVSDKNGKRLGEKLGCFLSFAEQKGFVK